MSSAALGVIPARWGAQRLPGKSLRRIAGKPLIQWVWERAVQSRRLGSVVVATDDERIRAAVEEFGGRVEMTRADHPSGTDRVAEVATRLGGEVVVNIQGDEPLMEPALIDRLVDEMERETSIDMATAATPIRDEREISARSVVKVVWDGRGDALYFSRMGIPCVRDGEEGAISGMGLHWRHIGIYAYRAVFLDRIVKESPCVIELAEKLEQLRALWLGGRIRVVCTEYEGMGVDTEQDVVYVERALRRAAAAGGGQ